MAFRWRVPMIAQHWMLALMHLILQGIRTSIAKKPYIFGIFQGGGASGLPLFPPPPSGSAHAVRLLFSDIDECTNQPGLCEHNCANTAGSYICTCPPRHSLRDDGQTCRPFDDYSNVYFFFLSYAHRDCSNICFFFFRMHIGITVIYVSFSFECT